MSWSIYATGSREGVRAKVQAMNHTFADPLEAEEYAAAKGFILKRIDTMNLKTNLSANWDPNSIKVEACGSASAGGSMNLKIEVQPIRLEL